MIPSWKVDYKQGSMLIDYSPLFLLTKAVEAVPLILFRVSTFSWAKGSTINSHWRQSVNFNQLDFRH